MMRRRNTNPSPVEEMSSQHFDAFSEMELDDFRETFELFDGEGVGRIRCGDMLVVLESLKSPAHKTSRQFPHLDLLLSTLSRRKPDDTLDFDGFVHLMASTTLQNSMKDQMSPEENFAHVFKLFDVNHKGYISIQDLERVAMELGETDMTKEELREMLERAQTTRDDGRVYLSDFTNIMTMDLFQKNDAIDGIDNNA